MQFVGTEHITPFLLAVLGRLVNSGTCAPSVLLMVTSPEGPRAPEWGQRAADGTATSTAVADWTRGQHGAARTSGPPG